MLARTADAVIMSSHGPLRLEDFLIGVDMFVEWAGYFNTSTVTVPQKLEAINRNPICASLGTDMPHGEKRLRLATQYSALNIANINYLQCSEKRDKAYAFLWALSIGSSDSDRSKVSLFDVDYFKPIEQVYTELSVAIGTLIDTYWIFYNACQDVKRYSLPSWVSDWSSPTRDRFLYHMRHRDFKAGAGGGILRPTEFRGNSMFIDGVLVTTVSHCFDIPKMVTLDSVDPTDHEITDEMFTMLDLLVKLFDQIRNLTSEQPDRRMHFLNELCNVLFLQDRATAVFPRSKIEAQFATSMSVSTTTVRLAILWRILPVLLGIRLNDADTTAEMQALRFQELERSLIEILAPFLKEYRIKKYIRSIKPLENPVPSTIFELGQKCGHAIDFAHPLIHPRIPEIDTIFFTADARIGSGMSVREGDHVAVWDGLNCPVVLRQHDTATGQCGPWSLKSIAQVSGLMQGEAYNMAEKIRFEIR